MFHCATHIACLCQMMRGHGGHCGDLRWFMPWFECSMGLGQNIVGEATLIHRAPKKIQGHCLNNWRNECMLHAYMHICLPPIPSLSPSLHPSLHSSIHPSGLHIGMRLYATLPVSRRETHQFEMFVTSAFLFARLYTWLKLS